MINGQLLHLLVSYTLSVSLATREPPNDHSGLHNLHTFRHNGFFGRLLPGPPRSKQPVALPLLGWPFHKRELARLCHEFLLGGRPQQVRFRMCKPISAHAKVSCSQAGHLLGQRPCFTLCRMLEMANPQNAGFSRK